MKEVKKDWGKEIWIVNNELYCGKILVLNAGWTCSYHYHPIKTETFYCLHGQFILNVDGVETGIDSSSEPITITAGTPHSFRSRIGARILEISTRHSDEDVVRIKNSERLLGGH